MTKVYYSREYRTYVIRDKSRTIRVKIHSHAHEHITKLLPSNFKFYFVFTQPDIREKTEALLKVLELMPQFRSRIGVLVSYAKMDQQTLECVKKLKESGIEIMLDSGAFHVLNKKIPISRYQSYRDQYLRFINKHIELFDWIVTMDIPCDERPDPSIQQMPNKWKIEKTIENTLYLIDRVNDPRKFIAVVQGYSPEEYQYCCELMKRYGIVTARTGVGSLCVRKYDGSTLKEVVQVLDTVRRNLPSWVRLHAFGLNIKFLQHEEVRSKLNSSDSDAWVYSYSKFNRLTLYDFEKESIVEIDTHDLTRYRRKVNIESASIYFYSILSYILKLSSEKVL